MSLGVDLTVAAIAERNGRFLIVQDRAARHIVLYQPADRLEVGESLFLRRVRNPLALLNHVPADPLPRLAPASALR